MKDFGLKEIFCEILTGLAVMGTVAPIAILAGIVSADQIAVTTAALSGATLLTLVMVIAYVLGVVFDAVGLAIGELGLDELVAGKGPSEDVRKAFWKDVPEQVLAYRDRQWAYYACYRNLLLLLPVGVFFWSWILWKASACYLAVFFIVAGVVLELCLFCTMRILLELYFLITSRSVAA